MKFHLSTIAARILIFSCVCSFVGCEPSDERTPNPASQPAATQPMPVLWRRVDESTVVAVQDAAMERALSRATIQAREGIDDARRRWAVASPAEHALWAVKWAAPVATTSAEAAHEFVWVQPVTWSVFRIEGLLLSAPTAALESGRSRGEMVAFPIDELVDWIHFASDAPNAAFEGGYTVRVLEERYGKVLR